MPRLLDLFCGAGGCSVGYARAGFEVVGVDLHPQSNYPFEFHEADAMTYPLDGFDAIHASPPCHAYSSLNAPNGRDYPELIAPTRERLIASGLPYVIENVAGAKGEMRSPTLLCGSMVGLPIRRHRLFETNWYLMAPPCQHGVEVPRFRMRNHGKTYLNGVIAVYGDGGSKHRHLWREAMEMPWATNDEIAQAVPPAYTELVGHQLLSHVMAMANV